MKITKRMAIFIIILSTFLNTFAEVSYKLGANKLELNVISIITNYSLFLGLTAYGVSACLLIIALRGGKLSVLYPIFATGYVWVTLTSIYFFHEVLSLYKIFGVLFIILGILPKALAISIARIRRTGLFISIFFALNK